MEIEKNELSLNARGGTELMLERLYASLPSELLSQFQIIPSRVRELSSDKKKILWLHDLPTDPESQHLRGLESRKRFSKIVAVSNWQMQMYNLFLEIPYSECIVLKNAIYPIEVEKKELPDKIRLIYHTTPHRGLAILLPVFEELSHIIDGLHLDVYSSFSIYGWPQRDEPYHELFRRCQAHPNITYHGAVSNAEIRQALKRSHIFAYPSIWPETSCIAAIEAMSAKNIVVCPNLAALPETTAGFASMYQWSENQDLHAQRFKSKLQEEIIKIKTLGLDQHFLDLQKSYTDRMYDWNIRSKEWMTLLQELISDCF